MRPIVTRVVWSFCVSVRCSLLVSVSLAKTDEPIQMLFDVWTRGTRGIFFRGGRIARDHRSDIILLGLRLDNHPAVVETPAASPS